MGNLASTHLSKWERAWREAPGVAGFVGRSDFTRQREGRGCMGFPPVISGQRLSLENRYRLAGHKPALTPSWSLHPRVVSRASLWDSFTLLKRHVFIFTCGHLLLRTV